MKTVSRHGKDNVHPVAAIVLNGFEDSAKSWQGKNNEHGKLVSGENLTGLFMSLYDKTCLLYSVADAFDYAIEKL